MLLVLGAVVFSAAGQLFLKSGAQALTGVARIEFLLAAARDARVLAGILAWAASTVCWLYVLRVAPLSRAYLLSSLTYVFVPLAGVYAFGEHLRRVHVVGMVLILTGVACLLTES
jgi:drug/metabolite transporter (DMT)-like permease